MFSAVCAIAAVVSFVVSPAFAQGTNNPFVTPIAATEGVITVNVTEFAAIPDAGTEAARMNLLLDEPATRRLFVNTMRGQIYSVSYNGKTVTPYLDINAAEWGVPVNFAGTERGFQSFGFHPQFTQPGARGCGKFYTYTDTSNMTPKADFLPSGDPHTHDTVLLEWTATAARTLPRRASVSQSQRRHDRLQPAGASGR